MNGILLTGSIWPIIDPLGQITGSPEIPNPIQGDGATGLGDTNYSVFLSPAEPEKAAKKFEDTGPMTKKRMETADTEFIDAAIDCIERAHKDGKPFFTWITTTRMHLWTHLTDEWNGKSGKGLYPDGMLEHDNGVGRVLATLKELGIDDNTIVFLFNG